MLKRLIAAAAVIGLAALAQPALAQNMCAGREQITGLLVKQYGEEHRAAGLQSPTQMVEIWVSQASGTWTILITRADGLSCIAASGQHWQERDWAKTAPGAGS